MKRDCVIQRSILIKTTRIDTVWAAMYTLSRSSSMTSKNKSAVHKVSTAMNAKALSGIR